MKKYFFSGLAILLPIAVTILIFVFFVDLFTTPFLGIVDIIIDGLKKEGIETEKYKSLFIFLCRIFVLILLVIITIILGFLAQRFLFKGMIHLLNRTLLKIPIIKRIYRIAVDVTKSFFENSEKIFQKTVMVPFPNETCRTVGFLTGEVPRAINDALSQEGGLKSVFVPTAPHPISGFLIMLSQDKIKDVDLSTEEAFKFLVSGGIYLPEKKNP